MPTILLIRHAENEYIAKGRLAGRLPGVHLNNKGRQQALALAEALAEAPIQTIYSSPLERCLETAQPLAEAMGLKVVPSESLLEVDFGEWQGKTFKQLRRRKLWKVVQNTPSRLEFPGGETFASAQMRIVQALETISQDHPSKELVACFSHGDIIRLALAYYLGTPLDLFQRITVSPASISTLHLDGHGVRVLNFNHQISLDFGK